MEQFRADLHIHSRYSRATSKALTPRLLAAWAKVKGVEVLGTGDFTHAGWREELQEALEPDEKSGLLQLKSRKGVDRELPWLEGFELPGKTLFMLQAEISSIYKRGGKVRKVHNLVYVPTMEAAEKLSLRLAKIGNLESDGRPILGLDSRDLLEMVLETDPLAFLVPAHIWTPWFSLFGSKSGFDDIEECFGDLSKEIFALETGLSSDPEMNWMLSALDRFRMVSNSDAHSGEKLAREANLFSGEPSYEGIYRALRGEALGHKFLGTLEFFPEEGKYHMDGHRKCGVVLEPKDTLARGGSCPVCGKQLTVGVLHRVTALADRDSPKQPPDRPGYESLTPLAQILSEVLGVGPKSKKVMAMYAKLIMRFGSELTLLRKTPPEDAARVSPMLAEGLQRMRRGQVLRNPGYDGEFGVISLFSPKERKELRSGRLFLSGTSAAAAQGARSGGQSRAFARTVSQGSLITAKERAIGKEQLNDMQRAAVQAGPGPVLVQAGPGTGKTHTLMGRIASLVYSGVSPRRILALTFTRRAARELEERLVRLFGESVSLPRADTLHALAFEHWKQAWGAAPVVMREQEAQAVFFESGVDNDKQSMKAAWETLCLNRETREPLPEAIHELHHAYIKRKESWNLVDYADLLEFWLEQIQSEIYACPYTHVLVDEVQDLSRLQLELVRGLVPESGEGFFAIGDPDQSIYGFRGSLGAVKEELQACWPGLEVVTLQENYRSVPGLLQFSALVFPGRSPLQAHTQSPAMVRLFEAPSAESEASWVGDRVRELLGQTSHSLRDSAADDDLGLAGELSPGDIAVLVRFKSLIPPLLRSLDRLGVPCGAPEKEAFWADERVQRILAAAGAFLGLARPEEEDAVFEEEQFSIPEKILARGPVGLAAYLEDTAPFDQLFWRSPAFRMLAAIYEEQGGWPGLINWVQLQSELEMVSQRSEKVQILTLHAAKGLEFDAVFMPALEDGLLPFAGPAFLTGKPDADFKADVEEERRLFYVGLTRARIALFLSRANKRTLYGREMRLAPSRFLAQALEAGGDKVDGFRHSRLVARNRRAEHHLSLM